MALDLVKLLFLQRLVTMPEADFKLLCRIAGRTEERGSCWLWQGSTTSGYGKVNVGGKYRRVHVVVYELLVGPVPTGHLLDHRCRNRTCCCPDHLEPKLNRPNTLEGVGPTAENARKTSCPRGHPYDQANTAWSKRGDGTKFRVYRACRRRRTHQEATR